MGCSRKGTWDGSPYAPTGYLNSKLDKVIEIDPERAPFIRKAFKLYDAGLYSLKELGKKLYDEGFRARSNSNHISKTTIEGILKNPFYYGFFRNREHVFPGKHTPLVSRGLWIRVQNRLMDKNQRKGKTKLAFIYRGLLSCGECGCSITAETHKGHVYYRCSKSRGKCSQSYMREEELESQLSGMLDPIMMDVRTFELIMTSLNELYRDDKAHQDKITKSLRIKLARLKEEKKRLFRKMINDQMDDQDMYNDLREDIDNQMVEIGMQIANLTQGTHDWLEQSSNLLRVARHVKQLFLEGTNEQKQKVVETVSSNRILKDGKLGFIYKKPFDMLVKGLESTDWLRMRYDLRTFFIYNEWQCAMLGGSKHAVV